ncbi:NAD(P)/FAD-dependent oxidoreductase [Salinimicrobium gaetbulicola]|uniref:NAD(P)/FAD-dependent oxidoreductase n=1 Tax=Salinimicrobium gaetbulicola TaxID=999702 RepID=A0ABW3II58_9FLAO
MNFSFWEQDTWFNNIDFTIIGSGITGLNCAWRLKQRFPAAKVLVLERGLLPNGASTKNAGFACFGSLSEILDDLNSHSEEEVVELVEKRVKGLEMLRKNLGDTNIGFHKFGGYELFTHQDKELFLECVSKMAAVNRLLKPVFKEEVFSLQPNKFGFKQIGPQLIFNKFEGQLDTGKMMSTLLHKVQSCRVKILNNTEVIGFSETGTSVEVKTENFSFKTNKLLIATNGFASQLGLSEVNPARAQVLITKPIENLELKGTFHLDKGYYYFRNVNDRILFGGGRNLDFKAEETTELELTELIQDKLEELLQATILPGKDVKIEHRWSGIMGVGAQKKPVLKQISENVFCGVRLGGMGVAIGSQVGRELADLID